MANVLDGKIIEIGRDALPLPLRVLVAVVVVGDVIVGLVVPKARGLRCGHGYLFFFAYVIYEYFASCMFVGRRSARPRWQNHGRFRGAFRSLQIHVVTDREIIVSTFSMYVSAEHIVLQSVGWCRAVVSVSLSP